jgi:pyruvate/2-oxoglutarate/acetoin dehydrogenase E1 component
VEDLNRALLEIFETRDDVELIGEDLLDPYGGAFNASKGLSERWPDRVITTPISEASLFGIAAGMAIRGRRPILEIMFGDFLALGFDQIVNGISKFREMYDEQVSVPIVVRAPMGGRRGYGPTHSQSLEKLLIGVPNITVVAASEFHDWGALLRASVESDDPIFFIESKIAYGKPARRPETDDRITIVTYGAAAPIAMDAATEMLLEEELFSEVVVLGQVHPLDLEPVTASVGRTGALVSVEEGGVTGGFGSEIAAQVQRSAWSDLRHPIARVGAHDGIIPSAPGLEDEALPSVADVVAAVEPLV